MALRARSYTGGDTLSRVTKCSIKANKIQLMRDMNIPATLGQYLFLSGLMVSAPEEAP